LYESTEIIHNRTSAIVFLFSDCLSGCHPQRGSAVAVVFLVVIPKGDLLLQLTRSLNPNPKNRHFDRSAVEKSASPTPHKQLIPFFLSARQFIFRVFSPKIACQVPNPLNPLPSNNIRLAR
jgi:hypothetical protein